MPYLGRQDPALGDLGLSPRGVAPAPVDENHLRARQAVTRAAVDDDDCSMLLQALGLQSTPRVTSPSTT